MAPPSIAREALSVDVGLACGRWHFCGRVGSHCDPVRALLHALKVNKRLRTWFFPAGEEPEIGDHPEPDLWGVPNSFFTLNERWWPAQIWL